jgi:uncharacterized OB-fold protein
VTAASEVRRPAPLLTEDNLAYWEAARDREFRIQGCADCGKLRHPPRPMCPHCGSLRTDMVAVSGKGAVYSYAILHHPQAPVFDYPVQAVLVDLDEGVRVLSNIVGAAPGDIRIGMPVQVEFADTKDGWAVPVFRPVAS